MFVNLGPTNLRARPARIIRRGSDLVFTWEWRLFWALFSSEKDLISSVYPSKVCAYHVLIEVKQLDTKQHCLRWSEGSFDSRLANGPIRRKSRSKQTMATKERDPVHPDVPRRRALKVAVSALCSEVGFGTAENSAVETLTEMIQSCKCIYQCGVWCRRKHFPKLLRPRNALIQVTRGLPVSCPSDVWPPSVIVGEDQAPTVHCGEGNSAPISFLVTQNGTLFLVWMERKIKTHLKNNWRSQKTWKVDLVPGKNREKKLCGNGLWRTSNSIVSPFCRHTGGGQERPGVRRAVQSHGPHVQWRGHGSHRHGWGIFKWWVTAPLTPGVLPWNSTAVGLNWETRYWPQGPSHSLPCCPAAVGRGDENLSWKETTQSAPITFATFSQKAVNESEETEKTCTEKFLSSRPDFSAEVVRQFVCHF